MAKNNCLDLEKRIKTNETVSDYLICRDTINIPKSIYRYQLFPIKVYEKQELNMSD